VDDVAVLVAQHLDLDVARALDELLDEDPVVAEAGLGLGAHGREALLDVLPAPGHADALAAAAGRGLDHDRIADLLGDLHGVGGVVDLADVAGHAGDAGGLGELLALDLVAHGLDGAGIGTDEDHALVGAALGEPGVFRQEAESRVNRLGPGLLAGGDDLVGHQIGLGGGRGADVHGLVGHLDGQAVGVGVGIDDHGLDAQAAAGLDHADRDFAPVGDQQLLEHPGPSLRISNCLVGQALAGRQRFATAPQRDIVHDTGFQAGSKQ